jgi:hypothetical protein
MHAAQKQIEERIEICTHWLQELVEPHGLMVEYKPRAGRWVHDHNWWFTFGEPPQFWGAIHLRTIEITMEKHGIRGILQERFNSLLKSRNAS